MTARVRHMIFGIHNCGRELKCFISRAGLTISILIYCLHPTARLHYTTSASFPRSSAGLGSFFPVSTFPSARALTQFLSFAFLCSLLLAAGLLVLLLVDRLPMVWWDHWRNLAARVDLVLGLIFLLYPLHVLLLATRAHAYTTRQANRPRHRTTVTSLRPLQRRGALRCTPLLSCGCLLSLQSRSRGAGRRRCRGLGR